MCFATRWRGPLLCLWVAATAACQPSFTPSDGSPALQSGTYVLRFEVGATGMFGCLSSGAMSAQLLEPVSIEVAGETVGDTWAGRARGSSDLALSLTASGRQVYGLIRGTAVSASGATRLTARDAWLLGELHGRNHASGQVDGDFSFQDTASSASCGPVSWTLIGR